MESISDITRQIENKIIWLVKSSWTFNEDFSTCNAINMMITCLESANSIQDLRDIYKEFGFTREMFMLIWLYWSQEQKDKAKKEWNRIK